MKVCCIHKEKSSSSELEKFLSSPSQDVVVISCMNTSLDVLVNSAPDVIIFDVTSGRGEETDRHLLSQIQQLTKTVPVLLVTNSNESSKYREYMLDNGVDGCIQMPFLKEELFLRLNKLVQKKDRRLFSGTHIDILNTTLDIRNHTVVKNKEEVFLTKTEYSILLHLFLHRNMIVRNSELVLCLHEETKEPSLALNVHIFNIRKKIKDSKLIRTIPLYGFMISDTLALP